MASDLNNRCPSESATHELKYCNGPVMLCTASTLVLRVVVILIQVNKLMVSVNSADSWEQIVG